MQTDDNFILLESVTKDFGSVRAVDDVSFGIRAGEFFSLLGPSGCGKTTLLRILAGLDIPSAGKIYIDGQSMSAVPANHRPTNMVFQNYAIFPHLSVEQNIAYGLRKRGLTKKDAEQTVLEALEKIKLPGYGKRRPHQLSGGQRQRVALARALVCKPKVLLLDEPLGALDKKLREEMQIELRQLQRSVGITFVFVTHDQEEALTMSDRIAVMAKGKVLQVDRPDRLYESPNSREVASFIGTMNFIEGTVHSVSNQVAVVKAAGFGDLRINVSSEVLESRTPVTIAIRPEKMSLSKQLPASHLNIIKGVLVAQSYLGDRNYYYLTVAEAKKHIAVSSQNLALSGIDISNGDEVWISWSPNWGNLLKDSN